MSIETGYHWIKIDQVNEPGLVEGQDFINPYIDPKDWIFDRYLIPSHFLDSISDIQSWLKKSQYWRLEGFRKDYARDYSPYFTVTFISKESPLAYYQTKLDKLFNKRGKPYLDLNQILEDPDSFTDQPQLSLPTGHDKEYTLIHRQLGLFPTRVGPFLPDSNSQRSQTLEGVWISPLVVKSLRSTTEWLEDPTRMFVDVCLHEQLE